MNSRYIQGDDGEFFICPVSAQELAEIVANVVCYTGKHDHHRVFVDTRGGEVNWSIESKSLKEILGEAPPEAHIKFHC